MGNDSLALDFGKFSLDKGLKLVTAESCTAGMISSMVADIPGSSAWLDRAFVVYSAVAKNEVLGVDFATIEKYDITSERVAREMALGALSKSSASLAIATTGLAGPSGGTEDIPVGTVCFAWAFKGYQLDVFSETKVFSGDRNEVRKAASEFALERAMELCPAFVNRKIIKP